MDDELLDELDELDELEELDELDELDELELEELELLDEDEELPPPHPTRSEAHRAKVSVGANITPFTKGLFMRYPDVVVVKIKGPLRQVSPSETAL